MNFDWYWRRKAGMDRVNDIREREGFPPLDNIGRPIKKIQSWPPGFADLKLKDGVYQE